MAIRAGCGRRELSRRKRLGAYGAGYALFRIAGRGAFYNDLASASVYPLLHSCSESNDVPWLSEAPITVTVAPSASQRIDLTVDATTAITQTGRYRASLKIGEDTPYPVADLPLTVTVVSGSPSTGSIRGWVALQGREDVREAPGVALRVSLFGASPLTPTYSITVTTDSFYEFVLAGIVPGGYTGTVKNVHALANARVVTIAAGENPVDFGTLREGDANDDNQVSIADFSILSARGTVTGDIGWDAGDDFNDSGQINLRDFSLLATNFGLSGDQPSGP